MGRVTHALTRYASGQLNGDVECSWSGDVEHVDWLTPSGRRSRARRIDLDTVTGVCRGCGHTLIDVADGGPDRLR